jgi:hypothetical protein
MQTNVAMLAPAIALVWWSLVMWLWMMGTRLPALLRAGFDARTAVGGTGADAARLVPERVQWKADNHNHLMEQPTLFYPLVLALALLPPSRAGLYLAWAYVGSRVLHSLVQATSNRILHRFSLYAVGTAALFGLAWQAATLALRALPA